jgi:hypothetical protein
MGGSGKGLAKFSLLQHCPGAGSSVWPKRSLIEISVSVYLNAEEPIRRLLSLELAADIRSTQTPTVPSFCRLPSMYSQRIKTL